MCYIAPDVYIYITNIHALATVVFRDLPLWRATLIILIKMSFYDSRVLRKADPPLIRNDVTSGTSSFDEVTQGRQSAATTPCHSQ